KVGWAHDALGDYATLLERIRRLDFHAQTGADALCEFLAGHAAELQWVTEIDFSQSDLSDSGLANVGKFDLRALNPLNLAKTRVTPRGIQAVSLAPHLEWLKLAGVHVGLLARWSLSRHLPRVAIEYS